MPSTRRPDREGAWWVDFRYAGRRNRKRSPVQTKSGADAFERVLRRRLLDLEVSGLSPFRECETIFERFVERWMHDYVRVRNRPATIRSKCEVLRNHLIPAFGPLPLRAISEERIDQLAASLARKGLAPKTINNVMSVLRTCLASAVRWNLLAHAPTIPMLRVPEFTYKYLSAEELQRVVTAAEPGYWRTFIVFLAHTLPNRMAQVHVLVLAVDDFLISPLKDSDQSAAICSKCWKTATTSPPR